ncbi:sphingosine-1-phosphate phosphatase 2 isoform X2 [Erythrolamprus reginae]|uniref:sphingosine-1-phosphate phosphatase 2 isoform X2 n=1 Tax=Erythrolamprus reginae TaxID=121349 RepID=UPI00396CACC6
MAGLTGSQLVARFQRRCGLFPRGEEDPRAQAVGNGSRPPTPRQVRNGQRPGFSLPADCAADCNGSPGDAWKVVMYIGQVMKDLLKWPRPHSPPVVKLEKKTNAEYGMPSTHAMAATAISFTFVSVTAKQYKYPLELGLLGAFLFSSLVGLSRIYTGMHTVLDVIVGSLISLVLTAIASPTWDIMDHLMLTSPFCPAFCIIVPLFLCYNYPKLDYYSPTRADTTTILGASAGAIIGFWANNHYGSNVASKDVTYSVPSITSEIILLVLAKFMVGISVLIMMRQIAKTIVRKSLCSWHKISNSDVVAMHQIKIEVPYKFITYSSIGLSATMFVPLLYTFFGLN